MELVERRRKVDSRGIQLVRSINRNGTAGRERQREREREKEVNLAQQARRSFAFCCWRADAARDRSFDFWDRWPTIARRERLTRRERESHVRVGNTFPFVEFPFRRHC